MGCENSVQNAAAVNDVRIKVALKTLLLETRLTAVENAAALSSVADLIAVINKRDSLSPFASYGLSNVFFNPDLSLWMMSEGPVYKTNGNQHAIVIRRDGVDFVSMTFEGSFAKHNRCPVKWCE